MIERQVRVLLVDDHEIVRRGVKTVLEDRDDIVVIGEAGTVRRAVIEAVRLEPDVTLMDLRLPDGSGVEACRQIMAVAPESKIVILTSYADEDALYSAVMAGAAGYILKDLDGGKLHDAIVTVADGGSLLDPKMATAVLERMRQVGMPHPADEPFATLRPQQNLIVQLIGDGLTNREIAEHLSLSEKTVKNYVSQIFSKLNVQRRSQVARLATERRLRREQS